VLGLWDVGGFAQAQCSSSPVDRSLSLVLAALAAVLVSGTVYDDTNGDGAPDNGSASLNAPPEISGTPAATAAVGERYTFEPAATDSDGDVLTFKIANRPVAPRAPVAPRPMARLVSAPDIGVSIRLAAAPTVTPARNHNRFELLSRRIASSDHHCKRSVEMHSQERFRRQQ
jgi:hypothetical protein